MSFEITSGIQKKPYKTVIYGVEGIGKTSLAAQFPDPLFIDTEGSTARMNVNRYPKPTSAEMLWNEVVEVINTRPCKTLVIDTFDWAERLIIEQLCNMAQKPSITSFGYGEGFIRLEEQVGKFLNLLQDVVDVANINVVITAHAQTKEFTPPDADNSYTRYEMKLGNKTTAKTANMLKEWADMVLFCNYKIFVVAKDENGKKHKGTGGQRVMYTEHTPAWDAKNRDHLPSELPLSFDGIAHLFADLPGPASDEEVSAKVFFGPENLNVVDEAPKSDPAPAPAPAAPVQSETPLLEQVWTPIAYTPDEEAEISKLPKALQDLMRADYVHPSEIQMVAVDKKNYMPKGMPVSAYPKDFIDGWVIACWPQVMEVIKQERELPF
ncbi:MAG: ATP-binding protein [Solobacterium sp.]|nr:ATP-binding protein [Solobacterium sp.]